jgi:hypothetical protein
MPKVNPAAVNHAANGIPAHATERPQTKKAGSLASGLETLAMLASE